MSQSIIAYVESKAASMRQTAGVNAIPETRADMIQHAIALEALASDLRAGLHVVDTVPVLDEGFGG